MNEALIEGINSTVSHKNSLVIAGDVLLGKFDESVKLLKKIRARRILILPGNHDRTSLVYGHHGARETVRTKRQLYKAAYEEQRHGILCLEDRAPASWTATIPMQVGSRTVAMSHYPYVGDSQTSVNGDGGRPVPADAAA